MSCETCRHAEMCRWVDEMGARGCDFEDSAKPQEPKTGYWIDPDGDNAICGCCNRLNHLYGTYCKHCGARMFEPQEKERMNE